MTGEDGASMPGTAVRQPPGASGPDASGGCVPQSVAWMLGEPGAQIPSDAPLYALLGVAAKSVGAFWAHSAQGTGLSAPGLAILQLLVARDGQKSSEVAARGVSTPATVTSVVDTLVRDGYVQRRREDEDRRVVRLYVTEAGRRKCEQALRVVSPRLSACVDFVDPAEEPVIRKFLTRVIEKFAGHMREERK